MWTLLAVFIGVFGLAVGVLIGFAVSPKKFDEIANKSRAEKLLAFVAEEKKKILEQASLRVKQLREFSEMETKRLASQNQKMEQMLTNKDQLLLKRTSRNEEFRKTVTSEETALSRMRQELKNIDQQISESVIRKTGLDKNAAKDQLFVEAEREWREEAERRLHFVEESTKENSLKEAKSALGEAIYRFSGTSSVEHERGEITVPRDGVKGVIVGRGGQNIRFFEELFGVDVVFNDAPDTISLSCFNLVSREVAKFALMRLMNERIIDEAKIRKAKDAALDDMDKALQKKGLETIKTLNLKNIHSDLAKLIGRLNYRTSYGQNVLKHSIEIAYFSRVLAAEIGANEETAFVAGFFHDIGKSVDQELGGGHDVRTKEILEKYGFPNEIVHAAWTHHDAAPLETVEAFLVKAADAISASRPGARSISLEQYLQKIRELEATASSFEGVKKAFAISAGREVRVMVDPELKKTAEEVTGLASVIAEKIEEKGGYPGKIKVTAIRVTKASDTAKAKTSIKH